MQLIISRHSWVKAPGKRFSVSSKSFPCISSFVRRESRNIYSAILIDKYLAFLSINISNSSNITFKSKICFHWLSLLNKGPVTSFSNIPHAVVLVKNTISLASYFTLEIKILSYSIDFKNGIMYSL